MHNKIFVIFLALSIITLFGCSTTMKMDPKYLAAKENVLVVLDTDPQVNVLYTNSSYGGGSLLAVGLASALNKSFESENKEIIDKIVPEFSPKLNELYIQSLKKEFPNYTIIMATKDDIENLNNKKITLNDLKTKYNTNIVIISKITFGIGRRPRGALMIAKYYVDIQCKSTMTDVELSKAVWETSLRELYDFDEYMDELKENNAQKLMDGYASCVNNIVPKLMKEMKLQ
ncbi:MAG: hypothetical protein AB1444_12445 [Spirochaetota bacterium]